jgi:hypothetical protein
MPIRLEITANSVDEMLAMVRDINVINLTTGSALALGTQYHESADAAKPLVSLPVEPDVMPARRTRKTTAKATPAASPATAPAGVAPLPAGIDTFENEDDPLSTIVGTKKAPITKAKTKDPAPEPEPEAEQEQEQEQEQEPEESDPFAEQGEAEEDPSTLTAREKIAKATEKLRVLFSSGSMGIAAVRKLREKYGVVQFQSIPESRADEFWADAIAVSKEAK